MIRRAIAITVAVLLALVGTTAVLAYVKGADRRALAGQEAVKVFVAQQLIPAGTSAKEAVEQELMKTELIANKGVPDGALTAVGKSKQNLVAVTDIAPGEIAIASRFGSEPAASTAFNIPDGKMAVTVELEDARRVSPFLKPGNEVAIFTSGRERREPKKDEEKQDGECGFPEVCMTRTVLERATVLGVGQASTKLVDKDDEKTEHSPEAENVALVTLALTQHEAVRIVHLAHFGNMYFALLDSDSEVDETTGVSDLDFFAHTRK